MDPITRFIAFAEGKEPYTPAGVGWMLSIGRSSSDTGYGIDVFGGNIFVCGGLEDPSSNRTLAYIAKINSSGVIQWQRQIDGSVANLKFEDVVVDYGSGSSSPDVFAACRQQNGYPAVAKYNFSGTLQWKTTIPISGYTFRAMTISQYDVICVGKVSVAYGNAHHSHFDKGTGAPGNTGRSFGRTTSGGYNFQDARDVSSTQDQGKFWTAGIYYSGGYNGWWNHHNASTALSDSAYYSNCYFLGVKDIIEGGTRRVYCCGLHNSGGAVLVKVDYDYGNLIWARRLDTDSSTRFVSVTADGSDVYCVGYTANYVSGNYDLLIAKYDSSGTLQKQQVFRSSASWEPAEKIIVDSNFIYIMSSSPTLAAGGSQEMFVIKLNKNLNYTATLPNGFELANTSFASSTPSISKYSASSVSDTTSNPGGSTWFATESAASASSTLKQL